MSRTDSLRLLAERAGVATSFDDVFGASHEATEDTLRAVLQALGFDASDEARARASLEALDRRRIARVLEPVYVVIDGNDAVFDFWLRRDAGARATWTLSFEDGAVRRESFALSQLDVVETLEVDGVAYERRALALRGAFPLGYHRLRLEFARGSASARVIAAPESCFPPPLRTGLGWGLAVQVYRLRSHRDAGIGDLGDLRSLCEIVRAAGGAFVGVNPLHWLARGEASPYAPTSRRYLHWLALDIAALPGARDGDVAAGDLAELRAAPLIDYDRVADVKARAARLAFERFRSTPSHVGQRDFARFVAGGGERLRAASIFAALAERFATEGKSADWREWPAPYRTPDSTEVAVFAREHAADVAFFTYLQWQADVQLGAVARACEGMALGLYRDLAVGTQLGGFDAWLGVNALAGGAAVGAPPDLLNRSGQNWGVAPFDPLALREAEYEPFVDLVRANVQHAGALRIDHVMGLFRLWWVPEGRSPSEGAYVGYRLDELLAILALESTRERFVVIGEDLGTVPAGFRERLARAGVLSSRVLQFEYDDERFYAPHEYPSLALVSTGTHDLPTTAGFWSGADIDARVRAGTLVGDDAIARERAERERVRSLARDAFVASGLAVDDDVNGATVARIANEFLAKTPAALLAVQLEDVLGETEQVNLPATTHEHPNWRTRHAVALEDLRDDPRVLAMITALRAGRGARADHFR